MSKTIAIAKGQINIRRLKNFIMNKFHTMSVVLISKNIINDYNKFELVGKELSIR